MAFETVLKIYANVPLDPRYEHTLFWGGLSRQQEYFGIAAGSVVGGRAQLIETMTNFSYHRKEREVKVNMSYDDLARAGANYVAIYNSEGAGGAAGWYFYFVTDMEYKSAGTTALKVELDVLQTYQFTWEIPACFVEREHVVDDTPGANVVPEGLELGEIIAHDAADVIELDTLDIIIQSNVKLTSDAFGASTTGVFVDKTYSGFELYRVGGDANGVALIQSILTKLNTAGKTDAIQSMWMYPTAMIDYKETTAGDPWYVLGTKRAIYDVPVAQSQGVYIPRNRKLLTYPFQFVYFANNNGEGAVYHTELFTNRQVKFMICGNLANDGVVRLVPLNYRGIAIDNESGLSIGGFPTCAWSADMYKIWMAQNANSQTVMMETAQIQTARAAVSGAANTLAAASRLDVGGAVSSAVDGAFNVATAYQQQRSILAAQEDRKVAPPQARGRQSSSCNVGLGKQTFTVTVQGLQMDAAKRIDSYFDMYGYAVNTVKVPEFTSRIGWNYVKTAGCVVLGDFDANDRRRIAAIFDRGVTLWHAPDTMYRYDLAALNLAPTRGEDTETDTETEEEVTTE